jgi:hypothetical protein
MQLFDVSEQNTSKDDQGLCERESWMYLLLEKQNRFDSEEWNM